MSLTALFVIFLVFVAIVGFTYGLWFETRRKPRVKKKRTK